MGYQVIDLKTWKKKKQYNWFRTFANPCYGFTTKMDVTKVYEYSKETKTSFFINVLYLVTICLNEVEEMRLREVGGEIRLYDTINPTYTVMTNKMVYENVGTLMTNDYQEFYKRNKEAIEEAKAKEDVKDDFNSNDQFDDYYMTCIPWLSIEGMQHPIPDHNYESSSVPRICWDKYRMDSGKVLMNLNITVSHTFVDGMPLSMAFLKIQNAFDNPKAKMEVE